jgi:LPXTG-motif cell wall-anchored protein
MTKPEASLALNSTPRRRFGVGLGVVLTGTVAGLIGFAGIASAHTPAVNAVCKGETSTLSVDLTQYAVQRGKTNHVKVTDGTKTLDDVDFQQQYKKSFDASGTEAHTFTVSITAWDDPRGEHKWTRVEKREVAACVTPPKTTTPTSTTPTSSTITTTESTTPPTSVTTTSPVAAPVVVTTSTSPAPQAAPALAETGASIAVPLGIGGVLLVGGAVLLFVVRRRSKA